MTQKQFYKSRAWKIARKKYIEEREAIDGGLCEVCHENLGYIVHHCNVWLDDINCNDPAVALNPANFRYECLDCHNKERDPRKKVPGRCKYGPNGEIISQTDY